MSFIVLVLVDFIAWKEKYETSSCASFVKATGDKGADSSKTYYYCNRSGYYTKKSQGKRHAKSKGTAKLNTYCTAAIVVSKMKKSDGKECFQAHVCKTHYDHQLRLGHLRLSKGHREYVASKLMQGVSHQHIFDQIRDGLHEKYERIHIISMKDIRNIEKAFGLRGNERHKDDATSVGLWVEEMKRSDNNPVLLYKAQGEKDSFLHKDDFVLALQTPFQAYMLKTFGNGKVVCIDSTHGTNAYDFSLTTVVVVDELGEGYPVAWCLSNRTDTELLTHFFQSVKDKSGLIAPRYIMTDDAEQFYNAWTSAFGGTPHKLLCTWHIDRAWRGHLLSIKDQKLSQTVYHNLRVLLEETDKEKFEVLLKQTQAQLKSSAKTMNFAEYFTTYYAARKSQWAACYRKGAQLNTNMYVEAFHRLLKHVYMKGKSNRRVDKCIHVLIKLERDKAFERLIKLEKGKISSRLTIIHKRHLASQKLSPQLVSVVNNNTWSVQSSTDSNQSYTVEREAHECDSKCALRCQECNVCVHMYSCNCSDALIHHTICKHIHLVASSNHQSEEVPMDYADSSEYEPLLETLLHKEDSNSIPVSEMKYTLVEKLSSLSNLIKNCDNLPALSIIDSLIKTASNAVKVNTSEQQQLNPVCSEPLNKNIIPQRPFKSTKKRRKQPSMKLVKPSRSDKEAICSKLNTETLYNSSSSTTNDLSGKNYLC